MSRFIRLAGQTASVNISQSDVCNILSTYNGTLSASNACLVCNLRTKWELICYCPSWTSCYGTSVSFELPTNCYCEFEIGFFGLTNCGYSASVQTCIGFGSCTCCVGANSSSLYSGIHCGQSGFCGFTFTSGSTGSGTPPICWATTSSDNASSFILNLKKTFNGSSSCSDRALISYTNCLFSESCYGAFQVTTGRTCTNNPIQWSDTISPLCCRFTRFCISSNCAIRGCGGWWYIMGMACRTCAI